MADHASTAQRAPRREGEPTPDQMISTSEAAAIIGKDPRTVERWVDSGRLRGGRPGEQRVGQHWTEAFTTALAEELGIPKRQLVAAHKRVREQFEAQGAKGSHRWVDARHAIEFAVAAGRAHLVPERWRPLLPQPAVPDSPAA